MTHTPHDGLEPRAQERATTQKADRATGVHAGNRGGVVLAVCLALFFGVLTSSSVTVVLPEMSRAFSVDAGQLSWVMSGYLLTFGVAIPFYGRLADKFGARRLFLCGILLFTVGSLLCALAPTFSTVLSARIIQATGGAAFPGLGMVIASRAFPPDQRGVVLGTISATIGVGSAVGPLLAGVVSDLLHWRALFGISAMAALVFPLAWKVLPRVEELTDGPLDLIGGVFMALFVTGLLYSVTQGSQTGWSEPSVIVAASVGATAFVGLVFRQRAISTPFIPVGLLVNNRYLRLVALGFLAAGVNLATLIGFPLMLSMYNELNTFQIGLVMLPGAMATAIFGVMAGRLVDRVGPRLPARVGGTVMLGAMVALSLNSGGSVLTMAVLLGLLGGGFALLNTPLAVVVSTIVRPAALASALSINTMMFFIGGSLGAATLSSIITIRTEAAAAWNPFYNGPAIGYSDAFGVLGFGVLIALALLTPLPSKEKVDAERAKEETALLATDKNWTPDCAIPWCPKLEECSEDHATI